MVRLDEVKHSMEKAAGQAEDMPQSASSGWRSARTWEEISAQVYDLRDSGTTFPQEIAGPCQDAYQLADQIKGKETEISTLKGEDN